MVNARQHSALFWFALQCTKSKQCTEIRGYDHMPVSWGHMRAQYPLLMAVLTRPPPSSKALQVGLEPMPETEAEVASDVDSGVNLWMGKSPASRMGLPAVRTSVTLPCAYTWTVTVRGSARMSVKLAESEIEAGWDAALPVAVPLLRICDRAGG